MNNLFADALLCGAQSAASLVELGLARKGEGAYVQCLNPCHLTGGGRVVWGHLQVSPVRIRQKKGPKRGHLQVSPLGRKKEI